ncbi:MAG: fused MFS/spermidine synthase [Planctomycetota bacterium]
MNDSSDLPATRTSNARPDSGRGRALYLWGIAFVCGAATMMVELTIVRLLAPFFGQTVYVWTNIIGVVLGALAVGYFLGGRLVDRFPSLRLLCGIILAAGVLFATSPLAVRPLSRFLIAEDLPLQEAFQLLNRGSFAVTALLFGAPMLLLGMVSPFAVKLVHLQGERVGAGAGTVYAISTVGSLVGTFLPTHVFVPTWGATTTVYLAAAALGLVAAPGIWRGGGAKARAASMLTIVPLVWLVIEWGSPIERSQDAIVAKDSAYQFVQVVRKPEEAGGRIELKLNEGLDSFHSVLVPGQVLTGGLYYDYFNLMPLLLEDPGQPFRGLIIGLAAGTVSRQLHHFFEPDPGIELDGVEIDPLTVEMGRRYFELDEANQPKLEVIPDQDGRIFLEHTRESYDLVVIDAYSQQIYIPFHLVSRQFFGLVRDHLRDGGIGAMNVGFYSAGQVDPMKDPVVAGLANTAAAAFGRVFLAPVENSRNVILFFRRDDLGTGELPLEELSKRAEARPELLALASYLSRPGITREHLFDPDLPVFTDDWAPIEQLSEQSLESTARDTR